MNLVEKSRIFAIGAHSAVKQVRKYTGEPYWVHPVEVSRILASVKQDWAHEVHAAAHLHDVVEDTGVTIETVEFVFGPKVATLVSELTDVSKPEDGNRKVRKRLDLEHLKTASFEGKSIKLADLISNSDSITSHDPGFARLYIREKQALLEEALFDGHPVLLARAWDIVNKYNEFRP